MTTGVRPPLLRDDWFWAGPPPSRKNRGQHPRTPAKTVDGLLRDLGSGAASRTASAALCPDGGGVYDALFFENADLAVRRLAGGDPVAVADALAVRIWALTRALHARSANPSYFRDPAVLVACDAARSCTIPAACIAGDDPPGAADLLDGNPDGLGALMLAVAVVDALIDDVAWVLGDDWDRAGVWRIVFPGTQPRGVERPTYR
jgi:hypothetical protein